MIDQGLFMIKTLKLLTLIVFFLTLHTVTAADTTVIMQNGLDSYEGCTDSYVYVNYAVGTENYGDLDSLKVHRESC